MTLIPYFGSTSEPRSAIAHVPLHHPSPIAKAFVGAVIAAAVLVLSGCGDDSGSEPDAKAAANAPYSGRMNLSRFVYRDINRNGVYDMADRPYAGQRFELDAPDGEKTVGYSNISGFANFKMSRDNPAHPIRTAGSYALTATTLEDMVFTTDDPAVELEIEALDGSPGGLVSKSRVDPLGVAPALWIGGNVSTTGEATALNVSAVGPAGDSRTVVVDENGSFRFDAEPGTWSLQVQEGAQIRSRIVELGDYPVVMSTLSLSATGSGEVSTSSARNQLVQFDNLTGSDTLYEIPNGYGGLNWHNWIATHHKLYRGYGYINSNVSGEFVAYNSSGHPAEIWSASQFDLVQLYLGVAWPNAERGEVTIRAWRDEELAYEDVLKAGISRPLLFQADYLAVTRVEFSTSQYWQLVIDDVTYRSR